MSTKISQLPAATSPVAPDAVLPVVQAGETRKASIDQLGFLQSGTGATTRTIQNKLRDTVSVKDFGAVGDGVTDDTAAFTAAFAAIGEAGAVALTPGTYKVDSSVPRPYNITITQDAGASFYNLNSAENVLNASSSDVLTSFGAIAFMDSADDRTGNTSQYSYQYRIKPTGSTSNYQKTALFAYAATEDPSEGTENGLSGTSINKDAVGFDTRGYILTGNMTGRAWGLLSFAQIQTGADGYLVGHEIDVVNYGSSNSVVGTPRAKYGLQVAAYYGNTTAAIIFTKLDSGAGMFKGLYAEQSVFVNDAATRFIQYKDLFEVDRAGRLGIGRAPTFELDIYKVSGTSTVSLSAGSHTSVYQTYDSGAVVFGSTTNTTVYLVANNIAQITYSSAALILNPAVLGNYADDTAAAAAGVIVGQVYRTGSTIKIRIS